MHKSNDNHKKGKYQHISMSSCNDTNTDTCVACSKYCDTVGEQADDDNEDSSASENSEVDSSGMTIIIYFVVNKNMTNDMHEIRGHMSCSSTPVM